MLTNLLYLTEREKYLAEEIKKLEVMRRNQIHESYDELTDKISNLENEYKKIRSQLLAIYKTNDYRDLNKTEAVRFDMLRRKEGHVFVDGSDLEGLEELIDMPLNTNFNEDDFMLVHSTKYFPQNNIIQSTKDATITEKRNTVHFAVNGIVGDHETGTWSNNPIIIFDPLKHHINQLVNVAPEDAFTYGSVQLSLDSLILISEQEFSKIKKLYPNELAKYEDRIVIFNGNPFNVVNKLLITLGYKPQKVKAHCWESIENDKVFRSFINSKYPEKKTGIHTDSPFDKLENKRTFIERILNEIRNERNNSSGEYKIEDYSNGTEITFEEMMIIFEKYISKRNFTIFNTDRPDERIYGKELQNKINALNNRIEQCFSFGDYQNVENLINEISLFVDELPEIDMFLIECGIVFQDNVIYLTNYKNHLQMIDENYYNHKSVSASQVEKFKTIYKKKLFQKLSQKAVEYKSNRHIGKRSVNFLIDDFLDKYVFRNNEIKIRYRDIINEYKNNLITENEFQNSIIDLVDSVPLNLITEFVRKNGLNLDENGVFIVNYNEYLRQLKNDDETLNNIVDKIRELCVNCLLEENEIQPITETKKNK